MVKRDEFSSRTSLVRSVHRSFWRGAIALCRYYTHPYDAVNYARVGGISASGSY